MSKKNGEKQVQSKLRGVDEEKQAKNKLRRVFDEYCMGNKAMDGKSFAKLAKDCKLLDSKLTSTDVDITFEKIKERAERRIGFAQFEIGLGLLAKKKGASVDTLSKEVEKLNGPILNGTQAEYNKFHDDKSLYTGVYANGGPSTVDDGGMVDLSLFADRSPADIRGVKKEGPGSYQVEKKAVLKEKHSWKSLPVTVGLPDTHPLRDLFKQYCEGQKTMDSNNFTQLGRDFKLIDNSLTATDINLIFVQIKDRDEQRINYEQFLEGLAMVAETKGVDKSEIEFAVTGTNADPVNSTAMGGTPRSVLCVHCASLVLTQAMRLPGVPAACSDTRQLKEVSQLFACIYLQTCSILRPS